MANVPLGLSINDIQSMLLRQQKKLRRLEGKRRRLVNAVDALDMEMAIIVGHRGKGASTQRMKRIRRPGVDFKWILAQLKIKPATLQQLQLAANEQKLSALSVMKILNANKSKLRGSPGTKEANTRGRAALVWSVKESTESSRNKKK